MEKPNRKYVIVLTFINLLLPNVSNQIKQQKFGSKEDLIHAVEG